MSLPELDELVLAALAPTRPQHGVEDRRRTLEELADVLGVSSARLSGQIELATALEELRGDELVEARTEPGDEPAFEPTDRGSERGSAVRDRLAGTTVEVADEDGRRERSLSELADALDRPIVAIAADCTADGVYYGESEGDFDRIVDRDDERAAGRAVLERARDDGTGWALFLTGPGGVGKTALAEDLVAEAFDDGFSGARATCQETRGPFGPIRDLLEEVAPSTSPFDAVDAPPGGFDDHETFETQQRALFYDVTEALAPADADSPRLLFLDDLHLADAGTEAYLEYLLDALPERPLALVGSYRPTELPDESPVRADAVDDDRVTSVRLDPLGRTGTRGVIERVLERRDVPDAFVDAVHERTGGSPLFVEETVSALLETEQLDPGLEWYPDDPDAIDVPDAVAETIDSRIANLDDDARELVRWATVIGDRVPVDVLGSVCSVPETRFHTLLEALVAADVFDRIDGRDAVAFRSEVVRDAVLEDYSSEERRRRHEAVAAALETTGPDEQRSDEARDERAAAIADHHERAGNARRAVEWYRRAGERATDVYAHDAAIDCYFSALKLARDAGDDETLFSVSDRLIDIFLLTSDLERAERYTEFVRERTDDPVQLQRTDHHAATVAIRRGAYDTGVEHASRGIERTADASEERCRLLERKAEARRLQRRYDEATELARRSLEMAATLDDDLTEATAAVQFGMICLARGDLERAEPIFEDVVELPSGNELEQKRAAAYNCLGYISNRRNDYETALTRYERALEILEKVGDINGVASAKNNVGILYAELGDVERALELYREVRETVQRTGSERLRIGVIQNIAIAHLKRGDPEAALEAIGTLERNDDGERPASVHHIRSKAFYYRGEFEAMRDAADRQLEIASANDEMRWVARAKSHRGTIARLDGDLATAIERHREAIDVATDHGLEQAVLHARFELVLDHAARGDAGAAGTAADALETLANEHQTEMVALSRGIVARLDGRLDDAVDRLERALAESRDVDGRIEAFRAREQLARVALARDEPDRARDIATRIREEAAERGVGLFVDAAEEVLALCGPDDGDTDE